MDRHPTRLSLTGTLALVLLFCAAAPLLTPFVAVAQVDVLTQHNDNARTGANLMEKVLSPATIRRGFGKIGEADVDGDIYSQPLYVSKAHVKGLGHNLVIVATMRNTVYAFDADRFDSETRRNVSPLWKRSLEPSVKLIESMDDWTSDCGEESARNIPLNIRKEIGIVSTPVISIETRTLYVVSFTAVTSAEKREYQHYLHALDLLTGRDRKGLPAVRISASGFADRLQNQRAGLLLTKPNFHSASGGLYVAFGSYGDCGAYHGWTFGYDPQRLTRFPTVFNTTPLDGTIGGGIWQGGQGPAADRDGNIYLMSGNGDFSLEIAPTEKSNYGNSFIKLSPTLSVLDRFTPYNSQALNSVDADLGSGGPMLLPDSDLLIGGGKEGKLYLLNRANLGGFYPIGDNQIVQSFQATTGQCPQWAENFRKWPNEGCPEPAPAKHADGGYHHLHGSPVYWRSEDGIFIYVWGEGDALRRFKFVDGQFKADGKSQVMTPARSMPGATLSLSANGTHEGIIWAMHQTGCRCDPGQADCSMTRYWCDANENIVPGTLRALDAGTTANSSVLQELWNSDLDPRDKLGNVAKFAAVTVANGKVYAPTFSNKLVVYGPRFPKRHLPVPGE